MKTRPVTASAPTPAPEGSRKAPVRSKYLFPAYDFGSALQLTQRVEQDGGGTLTEETLAIALGASAKSSGFKLRALAARQFGLLTKNGERVSTTAMAKSIFKPMSAGERENALRQAFLSIPLFKVVTDRFKGQPLPPSEAFRNVLEREFEIEPNRVLSAERLLMDSARDAGVLHQAGGNTYLTTGSPLAIPNGNSPRQEFTPPDRVEPRPTAPAPIRPGAAPPTVPPMTQGGAIVVSELDLASIEEADFEAVWKALGKIYRARGKRQLDQWKARSGDAGDEDAPSEGNEDHE